MTVDPVEEHLDELIRLIRAGAHPMTVTDPAANEMKERYRKDFSNPDNLNAWPKDYPKIAVLSMIVGQLAEFFTCAWYTLRGRPVPLEVDPDCLFVAGYVVKRTLCPPPGPIVIRGHHCENYRAPVGLIARLVGWLLGVFIRFSGIRVTEGPLTQR